MSLNPQQFQFEHRPREFGSDDYETAEGIGFELRATPPGDDTPRGFIEYEQRARYGKQIHIRWMETLSGHERRGIASAAVDELAARYPDHDITTGSYTERGQAWRDAYRRRRGWAPEVGEG